MNPLRRWHHNKNDRMRRRFAKAYANLMTFKINKSSSISFPKLVTNQKNQVDSLFSKYYGKKIPYTEHEMYTGIAGKFDPNYIPRTVYYSDIEFLLNSNVEYAHVLEDKNILPEFAKGVGVATPKTIWSNSRGIDYLPGVKMLKRDEIIDILSSYDRVFVKPSVGTSGGKGCKLYNNISSNFKSIADLLNQIYADFDTNFVVQEALTNCDSLRKLHPASLNTFRVITYVVEDEIKVAPITMRMGRSGAVIDNASAGGIVIGLDYEGNLMDQAQATSAGDSGEGLSFKCSEHPDTHIVFRGYKIPELPLVIQAAKKMHSAVPQLGIVNWDFTVTEDGQPCLIEANCEFCGGYDLIQTVHGQGIFGEDTPYILAYTKFLRSKTKLERDALQRSDFKFEG